MPLFPISSFQAAQSGEQNVKVKKDEITVTPEQGGEGGDTSNCFKYEVKDGDFSATSAQEINTDSQYVQQTFTSVYRNEEVMRQNYSELRVATEGAGIETGYFNSEDSYSDATFDVEPGNIRGCIEDAQNGTVAIGLGTVNGLNVAFDDAVDPIFNVNRDGIRIGNESLTEEELSAIKAGGGTQMEVLWTNANPKSSFVNQNIEFPDMLDYSEIIIEYIYSTNGHSPKRNTVDLSHFGTIMSLDTLLSIQGNWKSINMRTVTCWKTSDSGNPIIAFGLGMNLNLQSIPPVGSDPTGNNILCIPTKIYGVK